MQVASDVVETSMSGLSNFQRCRKKWRYAEIMGWIPKSVPTVMEIGTLFHEAMAAGNRSLVHGAPNGDYDTSNWLEAAIHAVYATERDRNGMPLHLDQGQRENIEDMVRFTFENWLREDIRNWKQILVIEEPAYIQIGRYLIRNTFDIAVSYKGEGGEGLEDVVLDFKTCDDPTDSKGWIPLDFQTRSYPLAARGRWGRPFRFKHIFQSRDVPPGFGHRPLTTETGKTRNKAALERMQEPARYIQVTETAFTNEQLDHFERKLVGIVMEAEHARVSNSYPETPIKMGPFACEQCPYHAPCTFEMDGGAETFQPLLYIEKGSEEWLALSQVYSQSST
jgi:PD-(D/E)XK nuclease superfamily